MLRTASWRELTVNAIMERTELSRASFYVHFDDRIDVLRVVTAELAARLVAREDRVRWLAGEPGDLQTAAAAIDGIVEIAAQDGPLIGAIVEASFMEPELFAARAQVEEVLISSTATWIQAQMDAGVAQPADARALAEALLSMNMAVILRSFGGEERRDPVAVAAVLRRIWAGAIFGSEVDPG